MNEAIQRPNVRAASTDSLLKNVVPLYLDPPPVKSTFEGWLKREKVPRFKCNPAARRGGGTVYWSVSHVEKLLRRMTQPQAA